VLGHDQEPARKRKAGAATSMGSTQRPPVFLKKYAKGLAKKLSLRYDASPSRL
jgi:hypothetical protein